MDNEIQPITEYQTPKIKGIVKKSEYDQAMKLLGLCDKLEEKKDGE